jgi:peptide/nickel transport system permease protein
MAIVVLVVGLTLVGEGLNETINPSLRKRRIRKVVLPSREASTTLTEGGVR